MGFAENVYSDVMRIREAKPLVLNVTNYVVANTTANALLALGASPAMSHNPEDLEDLTVFAGALVVNIGTPSSEFLEGVEMAGKVALGHSIPVVLDPVAAGATSIRTKTALRFIKEYKPSVVRGNASEIMAISGAKGRPKGVDSSQKANEGVGAAVDLAKLFSCVVCISGEQDYVTDGERTMVLSGGHAMMPLVTGLGCTASSLIGAFLSVNLDPFLATAHAMAIMSTAGRMAADRAEGPGTLQLHFYDMLYTCTAEDVERQIRAEML
ncbi:MAG: hydroxyethylthiazole kinase [Desulfovibrionaceae bacterium]